MNDLASKCRVLGAREISHVREAIAYKEGALPIDGARERVPGAAQASSAVAAMLDRCPHWNIRIPQTVHALIKPRAGGFNPRGAGRSEYLTTAAEAG